MEEQEQRETRARFGGWSYEVASGRWHFSPEVRAMWDIGLDEQGPVETVLARLHPEDRGGIEERLARTTGDGVPLSGQGRLRTDSGERIFAFYGDVLGEGDERTVAGYSIDITEESRRAVQDAVEGMRKHGAAIEQLKGALMVAYGMDEPEAFSTLRTVSMTHNVKLNVLADRALALTRARSNGAESLLAVLETAARGLDASQEPRPRPSHRSVPAPPASSRVSHDSH